MVHSGSETHLSTHFIESFRGITEDDVNALVQVARTTPSPMPLDSTRSEVAHHIATIASMIDPNVANQVDVDPTQLIISLLFVTYSSFHVCADSKLWIFSLERFLVAVGAYKQTIIMLLVAKILFWLSYYF